MAESTLRPEVLCQHINKYFIETGTARGEGVQVALDCKFEQIISIEANPETYVKACERFADDDNVMLLMGDSGQVLPDVLTGIHERCTFWLDAHWSTGECDLGPGVNKCPILHDLRAVAQHHIRDHVILIDDIRYFRAGLPQWGNVKIGDMMEVILNINPKYRISFAEGFTENDILVARVEP